MHPSAERRGLLHDQVRGAEPPGPAGGPVLVRRPAQLAQEPAPATRGGGEIGHPDLDVVESPDGQRFPPGTHFTSPSGFAVLDRMNSRSERRLRYLAASGLVRSGSCARAGPSRPLGPPGDGPCHVQQRRAGRAAGEDERVELGQACVVLVAPALEPRHVLLGDPQRRVLRVWRDRGGTDPRPRRTGRSGSTAAPPAARRRARPSASATPIAALHSSTSAYAAMRGSVLATCSLLPSAVVPASPVLV